MTAPRIDLRGTPRRIPYTQPTSQRPLRSLFLIPLTMLSSLSDPLGTSNRPTWRSSACRSRSRPPASVCRSRSRPPCKEDAYYQGGTGQFTLRLNWLSLGHNISLQSVAGHRSLQRLPVPPQCQHRRVSMGLMCLQPQRPCTHAAQVLSPPSIHTGHDQHSLCPGPIRAPAQWRKAPHAGPRPASGDPTHCLEGSSSQPSQVTLSLCAFPSATRSQRDVSQGITGVSR